MKSFMNAARIAVVSLLFFSLTALGLGCCNNTCAVKTCPITGCKLQPEAVKIRKTCDHPGYYKQVCHLEYEPCEGKVEEHTAMPIFKGCFDEQGNRLDSNGSATGYVNGSAARVVDAEINVQVPASYESGVKGFRNGRSAKRVRAANVNVVE